MSGIEIKATFIDDEMTLVDCPGCGKDYYHYVKDALGCYSCTVKKGE